MEPDVEVDAMVADAVKTVRDRFGADGLRDLVALATAEIESSERAVADLGELAEPASEPDPSLGAADTQAWIAYTVQGPEPLDDGDDD
jgi:hypothetical protein